MENELKFSMGLWLLLQPENPPWIVEPKQNTLIDLLNKS